VSSTEVYLRVMTPRRVFKPRIAVGRLLMRLGLWLMGATAEAAE